MAQDADVLVVGAGMSGIATAWALRQADIRSIVLEGRDRIGGRIHSSRKWKTIPCDLGASWVTHPTINPLIDIARERGIELKKSDPSNLSLHEATGYTFTQDESGALLGLYGTAYAAVKLEAEKRRKRRRPDVPLSKVLPGVLDEMDLDARTRRGVEYFVNMIITEPYATDLKDLSLYNWDDDYTMIFLGLYVVPDGYVRIAAELAKGLDVRKEHVVRCVDHGKDGVVIETNRGVFRAPHAVITVPHGVLAKGHIKFRPLLPAWKQGAIDRIHTGLSNKFWFHFPRKFWKSNRDTLGRVDPDGLGRWSTWLNFHKVTGEPVLMVFNRSEHAEALEQMSDDNVIAEAMTVLRAEFPGKKVPEPIDMQRSHWGAETFSEGTLPHVPPGASSEDHRILARPVGRLRFAGDSTHAELPGEVVGAFLSGIREAERLTCEYLISGKT